MQMFPPLYVGAALVVPTPKGHLDAAYIARLVVEHTVTEFIFSVPTMVSVLDRIVCKLFRLLRCGTCHMPPSVSTFVCRRASTSTS